MITAVGRLVRRDDGQDLMEYGLLAALIAVVVMTAVSTLGDTVLSVFWKSIGQAV
jgi:pilus assembly protein Flp/PilA